MKRPRRILMIKLSSLGDIIHSLPVLHSLKEHWPQASVDWLVDESYRELLKEHPELDQVIPLPRGRFSRPGEVLHLLQALRHRRYDLVIDLQGLLRSGILSAAAGGRVRIGFASAREGSSLLYNIHVSVPSADMHAVDRYLLVAHALGASTNGAPSFVLPERRGARKYAAEVMPGGRMPDIAISPATRWKTKCWPSPRYAALADRLVKELKARAFFLGGDTDRKVITEIRNLMGGNAINLSGTTLTELVALIRRADLLVSPDSGPMHIAAAVGTPVVALFGPTNPARTGPYTRKAKVLQAHLDCLPCYRKRCESRDCMQAITVEEVFTAVRGVLDER